MFALPMTLMVIVKIKHSAPDSAAKKPGIPEEQMKVGFPACSLAPVVEFSLHLDKPLPGEGKKGLDALAILSQAQALRLASCHLG